MRQGAVIVVLLLTTLPLCVRAQEDACNGPWKGKRLTEQELEQLLSKHFEWGKENRVSDEPDYRDERYANLCGANLGWANLTDANLGRADLTDAALGGANLTGADLVDADLTKADLVGADLTKADLVGANLTDALVLGADLTGADLAGANLTGANLAGANLTDASLWRADLTGVNLRGANLTDALVLGANLTDANLGRADLTDAALGGANLTGADLEDADLTKADLVGADLTVANLAGANLTGANLAGANLTDANLGRADLTDAALGRANLDGVLYEPKDDALPAVTTLRRVLNLHTMRFEDSPHALQDLRIAFRENHYRQQEREITYAIKRSEWRNTKKDGQIIEPLFNRVFFDIPVAYGLDPGRALIILVSLIPFFALFYGISLSDLSKKSGIWRVWPQERADKSMGTEEPELITMTGWRAPFYALYFSLLSAFHIGWRDLNIGNWIARIQRRTYVMQATGWVRTVSGIQSLISVYLVAIWALSYFGRPFE